VRCGLVELRSELMRPSVGGCCLFSGASSSSLVDSAVLSARDSEVRVTRADLMSGLTVGESDSALGGFLGLDDFLALKIY